MVRDAAEGKPTPGLISPYATERLAMHYMRGAQKYDARNWEKGSPFSRVLESLERHVVAWKKGSIVEDHLAAIAWNAFALMHYEVMIERGLLPPELDDMPKYEQKAAVLRHEVPDLSVICEVLAVGAMLDSPEHEIDDATFEKIRTAKPGELVRVENPGEVPFFIGIDPAAPPPRVYIAGPMRGYERYNFHAFDEGRDLFIGLGWDVISPADIDRREAGMDPLVDLPAFTAWWEAADSNHLAIVIRRDIEAIIMSDAIAMLPGWERSTGAVAEFFVARWQGLPVYDATTGEAFDGTPDVRAIMAAVIDYLDEGED